MAKNTPQEVWIATVIWHDGNRYAYCTDAPGLAWRRVAETLGDLLVDPFRNAGFDNRYGHFLDAHPYDPDTATDEQAQQWANAAAEELFPDGEIEVEVERFKVE